MDANNLTNQFFDFQIFATPEQGDLPKASGGNRKKLLLLVEEEDYTEESKILLTKIIQAVGFDLEVDAALLSVKSDQLLSFQLLRKTYKIEHAICFGLPLKQMGIYLHVPTYQIENIGNCQTLLADSLTHISAQKSAKAALWKNLQLMFPKVN